MNLVNFIEVARRFSETTFGPGRRTIGISNHIRKELEEIKREPNNTEEWIDVILFL